MKKFITSAIVLFSESIWLYFAFALFVSVEWDEPIFVSATWWIVAGLSGYLINRLALARVQYVAILIGNILILAFLVFQNWQTAIPEGSWVAGVFFSIALMFVYVRSAILVYKETTRVHMVQRFELNIFIYLVLMFMFTFKNWLIDYFHVAFIGAIFSTLFGMILTLETTDETEENEHITIHKVGNSRGLVTVISLLFSGIIIVSSMFFLPTVREKLQQFTFFSIDKIVWGFTQIGDFFNWIFSLFSAPERGGSLPDAEPNVAPDLGEVEEEVLLTLPIGWIFAGVGVIIAIVLIVVFGHFLKNWRGPTKRERAHMKHSKRTFTWAFMLEKMKALMRRMIHNFRKRFARFYKHDIYWYFTKIEQWGKKQGISRQKSETIQVYVEKLIERLENVDLPAEEKNSLINDLHEISRKYEAAYYGDKKVKGNYKHLIKRLNKLHITKTP